MDGSGGGSVDSVPVSLPDVEASSQPHSLRGLVPTHFYDTSEAVTVFPSQQLAEEFGTAVPGRVSAPSANQFPIDLSKHQMPLPADALFPGISFSGLKSLHKAASLSSRPPSLHTLEPADQTMSSPKQLRRIRLSRRVKSSLDASLVNSSRTLRKWRKKRLARFATSPTRRPPFASAADTSSALSAEIIREEAVKDTLDRVAHDLAVAKTAIRVYKKKLKRRSSNVSHPL